MRFTTTLFLTIVYLHGFAFAQGNGNQNKPEPLSKVVEKAHEKLSEAKGRLQAAIMQYDEAIEKYQTAIGDFERERADILEDIGLRRLECERYIEIVFESNHFENLENQIQEWSRLAEGPFAGGDRSLEIAIQGIIDSKNKVEFE